MSPDTHSAAKARWAQWVAEQEKARQKALQAETRAFWASPEGQREARRLERNRIRNAVRSHPELGRYTWAAIARDCGCTKWQARWYGRAG